MELIILSSIILFLLPLTIALIAYIIDKFLEDRKNRKEKQDYINHPHRYWKIVGCEMYPTWRGKEKIVLYGIQLQHINGTTRGVLVGSGPDGKRWYLDDEFSVVESMAAMARKYCRENNLPNL